MEREGKTGVNQGEKRRREGGGGREKERGFLMQCTPSREGCFTIEGAQFSLYILEFNCYIISLSLLGLGCKDNGAGYRADRPCWNHLLPPGAGWTQSGRSTPLQRLLRQDPQSKPSNSLTVPWCSMIWITVAFFVIIILSAIMELLGCLILRALGVEPGAHDMCPDAGSSREQCDLPGHPEGTTLLWISRQHHQGKIVISEFSVDIIIIYGYDEKMWNWFYWRSLSLFVGVAVMMYINFPQCLFLNSLFAILFFFSAIFCYQNTNHNISFCSFYFCCRKIIGLYNKDFYWPLVHDRQVARGLRMRSNANAYASAVRAARTSSLARRTDI